MNLANRELGTLVVYQSAQAWKRQRTQAGSRQDTAVQTAGANTAREGLNPVPGTAYNESMPNATEGLTVGEGLTEGNGYASAAEMLGEWAEGAGGAKRIINKDGSVEIIGKGKVKEVIDNRPYLNPENRPSFRKGVQEKTFQNAKGSDGLVRDPLYPEKVIDWKPGQPRKDVWDMGHLPEHKYSNMHKKYLDGELTPKEFRDWFNNPNNYRPELPGTNRGHLIE